MDSVAEWMYLLKQIGRIYLFGAITHKGLSATVLLLSLQDTEENLCLMKSETLSLCFIRLIS